MATELKPHISFIDKSFKDSQIRTYQLAIQLDLYGLDFIVFNPEKNKFIALESYKFDEGTKIEELSLMFDKILNHHQWFAYPFGKVFFLCQNNFYTLIPSPLFEAKEKSLYLGFNQPFQENSRIVYENLKNTGAVNIFYITNPVVEKVKDFWPNAKLNHIAGAFIESLSLNYKNRLSGNEMFINVRNGSFDLAFFKNNKLFYGNSFTYRTKEDFIYFLLSAVEHLALNPEDINLIITGKIDKGSPEYEMIYQYIKTNTFITKNDNFLYSYLMDNFAHHYFYVLFNVFQCEL